MSVFGKELNDYVERHSSPLTPLLQQLERETWLQVCSPHMISGQVQGLFLRMLSMAIQPCRVLEIGTFTGFSAICLAEGLQEGGELITLEANEEQEGRIIRYVEAAGLADKVRLLIGKALDLLPGLAGPFDLVFIDADKENYVRYYEEVIDKVSPGGWIVADNVLWYGKIWDAQYQDKDTKALRAFNDRVQQDPRTENLILPLRDGLMLARKK
jgi:predicted O-methyltransferase YrrM